MSGAWIAAGLCLLLVGAVLLMVSMTVIRLRDRKDASEVIPLEVAVCIQKNNGDLIIRQQRWKGALGLAVGLLMVASGAAMPVYNIASTSQIGVPFLLMGLGLLILGSIVALVSLRSFREPHVFIDSTGQTVRVRYAGLRGSREWPFDAIAGVTRQMRLGEDALVGFSELLMGIASAAGGNVAYGSGSSGGRKFIGLQLTDGQVVAVCTAPKEKAGRTVDLITTVLGKPVLTELPEAGDVNR